MPLLLKYGGWFQDDLGTQGRNAWETSASDLCKYVNLRAKNLCYVKHAT